MARRPALGRGLEALMETVGRQDTETGEQEASVRLLAIDCIEPDPEQPRRYFDPEALDELAQSIRAQGVLQPVLVRPAEPGRYVLVAGERRWRAAQRAGLHEVPASIRMFERGAALQAALVENVQRADLNPLEEAEALARLAGTGLKQEDLARVTGKSRSHVANMLRLCELPVEVQEHVRSGRLSVGHAKALAASPQPALLAEETVREGLTVRQVEERARRQARSPRTRTRPMDPDLAELEAMLERATGGRARIDNRGDHGKLTLEWASLEQLDRLIGLLTENGRLG